MTTAGELDSEHLAELAELIAERVRLIAVAEVPAELGALLRPSVQRVHLYGSDGPNEVSLQVRTTSDCLDLEFWGNCKLLAAFRFPYRR